MLQHRILVTGAGGFVGTWLMRLLHDYARRVPIELITAGRSDDSDYSLDIVDRLNTYRIIREVQPTAVIHLVAIAAPMQARRDPSTAWNVNFQGTLNMASSVLSVVPDCKFIYASSSEVYGATFEENNGRSVDERSLYGPKTYMVQQRPLPTLRSAKCFMTGYARSVFALQPYWPRPVR